MWFNEAHQSLIKAVRFREATSKQPLPIDGCDINMAGGGRSRPSPSPALAMPYSFYKHFDS